MAEPKKPASISRKKPVKSTPKVAATPPQPKITQASDTPNVKELDDILADRQRTIKRIGLVAAVLVAISLVVFGVLIYQFKSDNRVVYAVARVVPYPVQRVNNRFVTYGNYLFELNSIKHYYQNQTGPDNKAAVDFNTDEGKAKLKELKRQVLDQLKVEAVTRQLIAKHDIKVSDKEVKDQIDQITKQAGGNDKVKEVLSKYYGWSFNDFRGKIEFQLARQKLQAKITEDESINQQAKARAEEVLAKVKAGEDFAELARKHSQDSSAANGGDLGFFGKGQMVAEFEAAAFALEVGQTSDIVKSKFGYHIIKVLEKKDDTVRAAHILIKAVDFDQYLQDEVNKAKVSVYYKIS